MPGLGYCVVIKGRLLTNHHNINLLLFLLLFHVRIIAWHDILWSSPALGARSECLVSGGERRNLYVCSWKRKVELNSRSASHTTFSTVKIHIVFPHDYICILKNIIHRVHLFAITPLCFGKTLPCVLCSWEHQFTDKKPMKPSLGPPWPKSRGVATAKMTLKNFLKDTSLGSDVRRNNA